MDIDIDPPMSRSRKPKRNGVLPRLNHSTIVPTSPEDIPVKSKRPSPPARTTKAKKKKPVRSPSREPQEMVQLREAAENLQKENARLLKNAEQDKLNRQCEKRGKMKAFHQEQRLAAPAEVK